MNERIADWMRMNVQRQKKPDVNNNGPYGYQQTHWMNGYITDSCFFKPNWFHKIYFWLTSCSTSKKIFRLKKAVSITGESDSVNILLLFSLIAERVIQRIKNRLPAIEKLVTRKIKIFFFICTLYSLQNAKQPD